MTKSSRAAPAKIAQGEATRSQIIETAGRLFAASGYDGVSLRRIAAEAGLELSLLLYHFRSKEGLYQAVFERSAQTILKRRHVEVEKLIRSKGAPSVEAVLEAFATPWIELFENEKTDVALVFARSLFDHSDRQVALVEKSVDPEARFFIEALQNAAPRAPLAEIHRCYHVFVGSLVYFILERARITRLSGEAVADVRSSLAGLAAMIGAELRSYEAGVQPDKMDT